MTAQNNDFCPEMLSALKNANSILLCTHVSPDGDAVGSILAMGLALNGMGKRVTMACGDPVPGQMAFLPGADKVVNAGALAGKTFDAALAVDTATPERMGACWDAFSGTPLNMQIDHHGDNSRYARFNAVDGGASAAGCLVRRFMKALDLPLTREIGACLYCAISTDTGNFRFQNTTSEAFSIMAEIMETGMDLPGVARPVHQLREVPHLRLLGRALGSLRFFAGGRGARMTLTLADYAAAGALPEHNSMIVNYAMDIPGVEMAFLAEEKEEGMVKASLRCLPPYDVARIARKFAGGGHRLASGLRCPSDLSRLCGELEKEMTNALEERL